MYNSLLYCKLEIVFPIVMALKSAHVTRVSHQLSHSCVCCSNASQPVVMASIHGNGGRCAFVELMGFVALFMSIGLLVWHSYVLFNLWQRWAVFTPPLPLTIAIVLSNVVVCFLGQVY